MNASKKVYRNQKDYLVHQTMRASFFSGLSLGASLLAFSILISGFALIYSRDLNRRLFIQYQNLQQKKAQYQIDWSKLLLEQGAWSTQSRVQKLAEKKLKMILPSPQKIIFIKDL